MVKNGSNYRYSHGQRIFPYFLLCAFLFAFWSEAYTQVRVKDIVNIENGNPVSLIGYGLVVGLGGTGDRAVGTRGAVFTVQTISNMLERFGITVPKVQLRTRNAAAVMVTARMPAFSSVGSQFDVTVSSLGDATSLEGGVLLMTPLMTPEGNNLGLSQGPLAVGGYSMETFTGEKLKKNHTLVGRIPNGGYITVKPSEQVFDLTKPISLILVEPDFVTAQSIAQEINQSLSADSLSASVAQAAGPGLINLNFPDSVDTANKAIGFIAAIETLQVAVDVEARVVINERTGTIVAGGAVTIGEVMISHGSLTIHTRVRPIVSQPGPFNYGGGQTVVTKVTDTQVHENPAQTAVIEQTTTVSELALALNTLGLKPRDIISIFQAVKQAGALRARLIVN